MLLRVLALALLASSLAAASSAQPARTVPLDDPAYVFIERLQRRGLLLDLHPTALPYTEGALDAALGRVDEGLLGPAEAEWVDLLRRRTGVARPGAGELAIRADLHGGIVASTSARLDPLRPSGAPVSLRIGNGALFPEADSRVTIGTGSLVAQLGLRHSVYANDDPDGYDVMNRAMLRNEEGYLAVRTRWADVAVGRIATQWGRAGRDALFLSDNAHPFDALHLRLGGARLAVRSVLGELDSALPDGTFTDQIGQRPGDRPSDEPRIDRFYAAHRFDWRPSQNVALTVVESAIYSGANADPSLAYVVPTAAFAFLVDNTPKNVENNGALGGMLWGWWRSWTLAGELFIDDADPVSSTEPLSAALTGTLTRADLLPRFDAELALTAVTARAYNSPQPEGDYVFALRGIGPEFTDYVHLSLGAEWFAAPGLTLAPRAQALWQGEGAIENPYPSNDETRTILTGDVTRTLRLGFGARFQPTPWWWAVGDIGVNLSDGTDAGTSPAVHGLLRIGARLGTAGTVRADL